MSYRGEDLKISTPPAGAPISAEPGSTPADQTVLDNPRAQEKDLRGARDGSLWLDETLLDCLNQAFDLARAHRAREVGIEHLLYAMTRVDAAAGTLEKRGIRLAALRREAAVEIMSETAAVYAYGTGTPPRSSDLEESLRLAATRAHERKAPTSIDDILHVLAEAAVGNAGGLRLRPAPQHLVRGHLLHRRSHQPHGIYDRDGTRRLGHTELAPREGNLHNVRVDALEQMVRALLNSVANEPQILSGALRELQREVMAHRDEQDRAASPRPRRHPEFDDPMESHEQGLIAARAPFGADVGLLYERLGALERTFLTELTKAHIALESLAARSDAAVDLTPVSHRLETIEAAILAQDVPGRLKAVEEALAAEHGRTADAEEVLLGEIRRLASSVEQLATRSASWPQNAIERLAVLQRSLEESVGRIADTQTSLGKERNTVQDALNSLSGGLPALAESVGSWRNESNEIAVTLGARLDTLERTTMTAVDMIEGLSNALDQIRKLTAERLSRRRRFWYWLFGTDDWIAASWAAPTARATTNTRSAPTARER